MLTGFPFAPSQRNLELPCFSACFPQRTSAFFLKVFKNLLVLFLSGNHLCTLPPSGSYESHTIPRKCSLHCREPTSLHFHLNISRRKINHTKRSHLFWGTHFKHTEEIRPAVKNLPWMTHINYTSQQLLYSPGADLTKKLLGGGDSDPPFPDEENMAQRDGMNGPRRTVSWRQRLELNLCFQIQHFFCLWPDEGSFLFLEIGRKYCQTWIAF